MTAELDAVLARHGAVRLMCDDLGRKRLAYEIRKFQKGHYLELLYLDHGPVVPEVERALRLDDSVLRFLTVQVSPHVEDIEKRKADAAALEEDRARKAAERAAREAEEEAARVEEYSSWARAQAGSGSLLAGEKLKDEERVLSAPGAHEGPTRATGYFVVAAPDLEGAVAVARTCPHLRHGGGIVVRPIDEVR